MITFRITQASLALDPSTNSNTKSLPSRGNSKRRKTGRASAGATVVILNA